MRNRPTDGRIICFESRRDLRGSRVKRQAKSDQHIAEVRTRSRATWWAPRRPDSGFKRLALPASQRAGAATASRATRPQVGRRPCAGRHELFCFPLRADGSFQSRPVSPALLHRAYALASSRLPVRVPRMRFPRRVAGGLIAHGGARRHPCRRALYACVAGRGDRRDRQRARAT